VYVCVYIYVYVYIYTHNCQYNLAVATTIFQGNLIYSGNCFISPTWLLEFWSGSSSFEKFVHPCIRKHNRL
jgi:hypothetical protein